MTGSAQSGPAKPPALAGPDLRQDVIL